MRVFPPLPTPHWRGGKEEFLQMSPFHRGRPSVEEGESLESGYWEEALEPCSLPSKCPVLSGQWAQGGWRGGPGKV